MLKTGRFLAIAAVLLFGIEPIAAHAEIRSYAFASKTAQAPMDEYFGKLAMSPLGVENAIATASARAGAYNANAKSVRRSLVFVEDSVRDWEAKFPRDRWLPKELLSIKHVYHKCADRACRKYEKRLATWLLLRYPQSKEARIVLGEAAAAAKPSVLANAATATAPLAQH